MGKIILEKTYDGGAMKIIEGSELEISALLMLALSTDPEFRRLVTNVLDIYKEDQLEFDLLNLIHNPTNLN